MITQKDRDLVRRVLSQPELYPDEFKSWLIKQIPGNVGIRMTGDQLPAVDKVHNVDAAGGTTGEAQFQNGWVNFGGGNEPARYWRDPWGVVHVSGLVKTGTIAATIFALPGGYRPENSQLFVVISNGAVGYCTINPDGSIVATAGNNAWFSLCGISFRSF